MLFRNTYRDRKTGELRRSAFWSYEFTFRGSRIRETTGLTSKTAARDAERVRRQSLAAATLGITQVKPKLFSAAADELIKLRNPTAAPGTIIKIESNLVHLRAAFGGKLVFDIAAADVAAYQSDRADAGAASSTINGEVGTLRTILIRAGRWAAIRPDVRRLPVDDEPGRAVTADEEAKLMEVARKSRSRALAPAITLAANTGLRRRELFSLRWEQVDLDGRAVQVGKSKTKAGSGRTVPLNEAATATLATWARLFPFRQPGDQVFPENPVWNAWTSARTLARVSCRWHDWRHSFVTRMLERGVPLTTLSQIMGWSASTMAVMAKRYAHICGSAMRDAVGVLDGPEMGQK